MRYDLLIKGGNVLDPDQGLRGTMDIGIADGKIAAIGPDLAATDAKQTVEIRGPNRFVVPGLIDVHAHCGRGSAVPGVGLECVDSDLVGVHGGVTTMGDGGSAGVGRFNMFPEWTLPYARTRIVPFLNVGSFAHGVLGRGDVAYLDEINPAAIATAIEKYPGVIKGFKLRLVGPMMNEHGEEVATAAKAVAKSYGLPLMVHIGNGREPGEADRMQQITRHMLRILERGDILTHLCTPNSGRVLDANGKAVPELQEARDRGVWIDSAVGRENFSFAVATRLAEQGLYPDTIASDLTEPGRLDRVHSLEHCMAKFMAIGYGLEDVLRMVTANAARTLKLQNSIGALKVGYEADITILDQVTGRFKLVDTLLTEVQGDHAFIPVQTIKAGVMYAPYWGPTPWGWLPAEA